MKTAVANDLHSSAASLKMPVSRSSNDEPNPTGVISTVGELDARRGVFARIGSADPDPVALYGAITMAERERRGKGAASEESHRCENASCRLHVEMVGWIAVGFRSGLA
jgi:hypothetical protein